MEWVDERAGHQKKPFGYGDGQPDGQNGGRRCQSVGERAEIQEVRSEEIQIQGSR
jgi:hypothetical protein